MAENPEGEECQAGASIRRVAIWLAGFGIYGHWRGGRSGAQPREAGAEDRLCLFHISGNGSGPVKGLELDAVVVQEVRVREPDLRLERALGMMWVYCPSCPEQDLSLAAVGVREGIL